MLTENRKFHFVGQLTLERSRVLDERCLPKDDEVNWLFLNTGAHRFSFVYKIENPLDAKYKEPFKAELAFTMIEAIKEIIQINRIYEVLRGEEKIGTVKIFNVLE